jgi:sulfate/thiosulfate transport system ATP-binding protein
VTVTVSNLTKRFGHRKNLNAAVSEVSFQAPEGGVTTLLGPSGSGKTTVLRMIGGLEVPDGGSIRVGDREITKTPVRERGVGFVFQNYALFRHMTVEDNVAFGLSVRNAPKDETRAKVAELLSLVQLADYGHRYPGQLSGGQRQRIALARALATNPAVLLLDEPFGALDARVRIELRDWLREFHERTHVTTLLVTHDQEEALELSDHVVLLNEGKVAQTGSPHDLYDHPASPFVASFLGGANVVRARVENGRATLGQKSVQVDDGAGDGEIQAYVRPHDFRISKTPVPAADPQAMGKVERLIRVGGYVKLLLTLPSGEPISVQMTKQEFDLRGIERGDSVLVDVDDMKVFRRDYAI